MKHLITKQTTFAFGKKQREMGFYCPADFQGIAVCCPTRANCGQVWRFETPTGSKNSISVVRQFRHYEAYWALLPAQAIETQATETCFRQMYQSIMREIDADAQFFFDSLTASSIKAIIEKALYERECEVCKAANKQIAAYSILKEIYKQTRHVVNMRNQPKKEQKLEEMALKINFLLHTNLNAPPSLEDLANEFETTPRQASLALRLTYEKGYSELLASLRLSQARKLLESTNMRVSGVAYKVGIEPAHLSYAFKKRYGLTPRQVRETSRKQ